MATVLDQNHQYQDRQTPDQNSSMLGLELPSCLQGTEALDEDLLEHLCSSEDIWNGIQFPDLPDELLSQYNDLNQNSLNQFDDYPGLSTPPESPPDSVQSLSSVPAYSLLPQEPVNPAGFTFPLLQSSEPLTPPQTTPLITSTTPPLSHSINTTTPTCQQGVKNGLGQLVQVLKSGEVVPFNALLSSNTERVKQEVIGQKRPHPPTPTATSAPDLKLSKRQQRLIKNRESASLSRLKKKEYVNSLEDKLKEAALKNLALLKENERLKQHITKLEKENLSMRNPGSLLSSTPKPAIVFVVVLCFTLGVFPLRSHLYSPSPSTTSLSIPLNPSGRALMSVEEGNKVQRVATMSPSAYRRIQRMIELDGRGQPERVCSCPVVTDKHNETRAIIMNSDLSVTFDREERMAMNMLHEIDSTSELSEQQKNSLVIVNGLEEVHQQDYAGECDCRNGVFKFYKSLKKSMTRDLASYYLVSFKDHLLLDAPLRNNSDNPMLSVIVPAHNGTYHSPQGSMAMLQLDCQVYDSKIFHMEIP